MHAMRDFPDGQLRTAYQNNGFQGKGGAEPFRECFSDIPSSFKNTETQGGGMGIRLKVGVRGPPLRPLSKQASMQIADRVPLHRTHSPISPLPTGPPTRPAIRTRQLRWGIGRQHPSPPPHRGFGVRRRRGGRVAWRGPRSRSVAALGGRVGLGRAGGMADHRRGRRGGGRARPETATPHARFVVGGLARWAFSPVRLSASCASPAGRARAAAPLGGS